MISHLLGSLVLLVFVINDAKTDALSTQGPSSRRKWLLQTIANAGWVAVSYPSAAAGATETATTTTAPISQDELPSFLRDYTKLAPLGAKVISSDKTLGLSLDELATRLSKDLTIGSSGNQGGYFLTGDLSRDIFRDDAIFNDPTNRVSSLSQYQQALRILFDPARSTVEFVNPLVPNYELRTITGRIRSRGYLQLPWNPYVTAYESTIVYTIDEDGLIARQDQTWSKAASQALRESFTPSVVEPPLRSTRSIPDSEPRAVTRLFDILNGRRPYEYSQEEQNDINQLIEEIITRSSSGLATEFDRSLLPGTWILTYLQPGPDGAGIDRRIPFPDFDFNDNYQVFGNNGTVVNVGQVLGPLATVQVFGTLQEDDSSSTHIPKGFRANIQGGKLCIVGSANACIHLPIQGEGLFDSLYLGDRLRIGQNINGGGARVVQIRLDDGVSIFG